MFVFASSSLCLFVSHSNKEKHFPYIQGATEVEACFSNTRIVEELTVVYLCLLHPIYLRCYCESIPPPSPALYSFICFSQTMKVEVCIPTDIFGKF